MKRKPNNPRQISKREFERLAADLERFGDLGGVVHNETTGNFVGGNQRSSVFELERQGAQITVTETYAEPTRTGTVARGYVEWRGERYDYRRVRWDTETEDAACLVANLRGGSWDFDALSAWDGDLLQGIGFDGDLLAAWNDQTANLRELLESEKPAPPEDPGAQVDKAEELREKWQTATGQLWQLGEHRLICGDCTDKAVVDKVMQGERADLVFTDPPYNVNKDYGDTTNDNLSTQEYSAWSLKWFEVAHEYSDAVAFTPGAKNVWMWAEIELPKWMAIWVKKNQVSRNSAGGYNTYEPVLCYGKIKIDYDTWDIPVKQADVAHPVPKSMDAWQKILSDILHGGILVLDPFLGSGTTLIACERLGRKCRAVEISPAYVAVALERWATMTGGTPVLLDDGC